MKRFVHSLLAKHSEVLWFTGLALRVRLALTTCVGVAVPLLASANLVQDGSFEDQTAAKPFQTIFAGNTFGGWTVTAGSIDLINGYWAAADGNQSVDLSGNSHGAIQQTINVGPGLYHLTFDLSGNSDGPPTVKTVLVSLGNASAQFSFTTPPYNNRNMNWVAESWDVSVPVGGSTVLSFTDISGGVGYATPYGAALDNVSLSFSSPVPESGTLLAGALLLLPFGISTIRILRRRRVV